VFEYSDLPQSEKEYALAGIISSLKKMHALESAPYDEASYHNAYLGKTFDRLKKVQDLVPFARNASVKINGKNCRNIFYCSDAIEKMVMDFAPKKFVLIHGDPTFSNIVLKNGKTPIFIDPRGYFGKTEFFGDVAYDWVKLYYSLVSNYDQFNTKQFELSILDDEVELKIASSHWENLEETFFDLIGNEISRKQMKILLAIIWLSLTTYAWEDYDSICGAFYNGLLYLEDAFNEK
jgi:aminoglycoside phosphotransferase